MLKRIAIRHKILAIAGLFMIPIALQPAPIPPKSTKSPRTFLPVNRKASTSKNCGRPRTPSCLPANPSGRLAPMSSTVS
jgi:hypothetical protein